MTRYHRKSRQEARRIRNVRFAIAGDAQLLAGAATRFRDLELLDRCSNLVSRYCCGIGPKSEEGNGRKEENQKSILLIWMKRLIPSDTALRFSKLSHDQQKVQKRQIKIAGLAMRRKNLLL
jgi:hypothetical protein